MINIHIYLNARWKRFAMFRLRVCKFYSTLTCVYCDLSTASSWARSLVCLSSRLFSNCHTSKSLTRMKHLQSRTKCVFKQSRLFVLKDYNPAKIPAKSLSQIPQLFPFKGEVKHSWSPESSQSRCVCKCGLNGTREDRSVRSLQSFAYYRDVYVFVWRMWHHSIVCGFGVYIARKIIVLVILHYWPKSQNSGERRIQSLDLGIISRMYL